MVALVDDGEGAVPDQLLRVVLVLADDLHPEEKRTQRTGPRYIASAARSAELSDSHVGRRAAQRASPSRARRSPGRRLCLRDLRVFP